MLSNNYNVYYDSLQLLDKVQFVLFATKNCNEKKIVQYFFYKEIFS